MSIRIGIVGYGNLGRGVECAISQNPDTELVAVFTRRAPETVKILSQNATVYHMDDIENMVKSTMIKGSVILCIISELIPAEQKLPFCSAMKPDAFMRAIRLRAVQCLQTAGRAFTVW